MNALDLITAESMPPRSVCLANDPLYTNGFVILEIYLAVIFLALGVRFMYVISKMPIQLSTLVTFIYASCYFVLAIFQIILSLTMYWPFYPLILLLKLLIAMIITAMMIFFIRHELVPLHILMPTHIIKQN